MVDIEVVRDAPVHDTVETGHNDNEKEMDGAFDFSVYEEGETKFKTTSNFGGNFGCFGLILMYFVHKNQEKTRKNHKSLISRNQNYRKEFGNSVRCAVEYQYKAPVDSTYSRKLRERTVSMMSIVSTNWRESRLNLASSMTNLTGR